jgi:RNA polymerase sigma-70 factor (ECF subfamily)
VQAHREAPPARPEGENSCDHFSAFEGQHFGEGDRLQKKLDSSNLVEQTMLEAQRKWGQFRGRSAGQQAGWLRQIRARNLANAARDLDRAKRAMDREHSLQALLVEPAAHLDGWLAAEQSPPSDPTFLP